MIESYEKMFNDKPKKASSSLEKTDHPELDESEILSIEDQKKYQSIIGSKQWSVSLCIFDIATPFMTISRFRAEP